MHSPSGFLTGLQAIVPWEPELSFCKCLEPHSRTSQHCRLCGGYFCGQCIVSVPYAELRHEEASFLGLEVPICNGRCLSVARPPAVPARVLEGREQLLKLYAALTHANTDVMRRLAGPGSALLPEQSAREAWGALKRMEALVAGLAQIRFEQGADARVAAFVAQRFLALCLLHKSAIEHPV
jgi:hypothetical protein